MEHLLVPDEVPGRVVKESMGRMDVDPKVGGVDGSPLVVQACKVGNDLDDLLKGVRDLFGVSITFMGVLDYCGLEQFFVRSLGFMILPGSLE